MKRSVKKTILDVKPYVPGKPIEEVKRELGLRDVIKLASNENPYGPPPNVLRAVANAAKSANRYPDGDCYQLRQVLAKRLEVGRDQLIFGNGSDELIVLAARAFLGQGDEAVIAKPSFLIYDLASRIAGARIKAVALKNFFYDLTAMRKAVTRKTKIIFLGNPDNPSGKYLSEGQVRKFLSGLRSDVLVFIDEAYYEYVRARDYVNSVNLVKRHKNVFVTRTFSKMYGLAGMRIGYGIGDPTLINLLNRIREPFNVNSIAQAAALAVFKNQAYYRNLAQKVKTQRQYLYKYLTRMKYDYVESHTNFILVRAKGKTADVAGALLQRGIIVRDMSAWGLSDWIRVTIGTQRENRRFIKVIKELG